MGINAQPATFEKGARGYILFPYCFANIRCSRKCLSLMMGLLLGENGVVSVWGKIFNYTSNGGLVNLSSTASNFKKTILKARHTKSRAAMRNFQTVKAASEIFILVCFYR